MKVNILGQEYEIKKQTVTENPKLKDANGICELYSKEIILCDENWKDDVMTFNNIEEFEKKVLRHEIIHAFFGESGLDSQSDYARNEELTDWIAIQIPKMVKVMQEVGCL